MEIKYKNTKEDFIETNLYAFNHSQSSKRYFQSIRLISSTLIFLIAIILRSNTLFMTLTIFFSIIWFVIYPKIFFAQLRKSYKKLAEKNYSRLIDTEQTLILDESGILKNSVDVETKINWDSIDKVSSTDNQIIIFLNSMKVIVVPKNSFSNSEDLNNFLQYINTHKKYD